jgi:valyl-tRNA synthetase
VKGITKDMDDFKFYIASEKIYHYFWHTFCDKIIEEQKVRLNGENMKDKQASQYLLLTILADCLKILHPFMPFITEEIYQQLPLKNKEKFLMVEIWPK